MLDAALRDQTSAFFDELDRTPTPETVTDSIARTLAPFGAEFFCFNGFPGPTQAFQEVILASRLPAGWLQLYLEQQYARVDPALRHCQRTVHPFEYLDAPHQPDREPRAAEVIRRAAEFGLSRGLVVPVPSPLGCEGAVWIAGPQLELTGRTKPFMHMVALYAFDRIRRLTGVQPKVPLLLTCREKEVMAWVANGKSAWEVGEILGISKRTVDEHAQSAARKLGAANRTQAVAIAIRARLFDF
jgi:LuxR family quorum sensing-dependent transcriptional regulator